MDSFETGIVLLQGSHGTDLVLKEGKVLEKGSLGTGTGGRQYFAMFLGFCRCHLIPLRVSSTIRSANW